MMPLTIFFFFLSILEVQWAPHSLFPTFIFTLVEGNQIPWLCYGYNLKVAFQESILENWSLAMYFLLELKKKKKKAFLSIGNSSVHKFSGWNKIMLALRCW